MNGPSVIARAVHFAATLLLTGALTFQCFVAVPVLVAKTPGRPRIRPPHPSRLDDLGGAGGGVPVSGGSSRRCCRCLKARS
jgi:hypothetical protein